MLYCVINPTHYECNGCVIRGYEVRFSDHCTSYVSSYAEAMDIVDVRGATITSSFEETIL